MLLTAALLFASTASAFTLGSRDTSVSFVETRDSPQPATHGQCGVHVKVDVRDDQLTWLTTTIKDADGNQIGYKSEQVRKEYQSVVTSTLPYTLDVVNVDDIGALTFSYSGDNWSSKTSRCSVGGVDTTQDWDPFVKSGPATETTNMDCGFAC
jgi:hypothetical protein